MPRADLALVPDLERELDELYGLPLTEFTSARNELAKRLKKAGQAADGERVAKLAKPPISAWAVNQLARRAPDRVRALLDAGEEVVEAQKAALAGKGAERFDDAARRHRDAIRGLLPAAVDILEGAGHRPSDAIKERVASSLRAASMDPDGRGLLEQGRFVEDFESAGLGLLAGIAPAGGGRSAVPASAAERREARREEAREKLEAAQEEERELADEAAEADRDATRAAAAAEEAADRARALARRAAEATKAVKAAEQALRRLER